MSGPLLTTRAVAELLGLSPATVLRRVRRGELPGFRLASNCLRFDRDEIDAWLQARHLTIPEMREPAFERAQGSRDDRRGTG